MADRISTNVLPFEAPESPHGTHLSAEASQLLAACRDRLVQGVASAFAQNLGRANDDLLGMADRATSLEQQQLYFTAMEVLAKRGQNLLQHFRAAYVNHFDASLAALRRSRRVEPAYDLGELRLVDTDDFERDLAIGKLSARAACNCANQLTALDRRLAALLKLPRISQDDNPLYPRALFAAMLSAFGDMNIGQQLGLTLLQQFERQTAGELPGIYNDLNRHLVEYGILPKIPLGAGRSTLPSAEGLSFAELGQGLELEARIPGPSDEAPNAGPSPNSADRSRSPSISTGPVASPSPPPAGQPQGLPSHPALTGDEVFAQLLRAIQASAQSNAPAMPQGAPAPFQPQAPAFGPSPTAQPPAYPASAFAPPFAHPATMAAPAAAGPTSAGAARSSGEGVVFDVSQLVDALTHLQRGPSSAQSLPGIGSVQIDPARSNALQQIRTTPLATASHPVDAMTIDIVAMLFDAIFRDPELPASLRAEIAKLQIPVLKVALMDKAFFSNKRHPARRLLDVIASAAIGRSESEEPRLLAKIGAIVDDVVAGFETDIHIFATQVAKLEEFLKDEEARAQTRATPVVDKLQQADREELASARAAAEIARRVQRRNVPTLVSSFLDRYWRQVLVRAYVRAGDEGAAWVEALSAMDDLLWSIEPKRGAEERNLLLGTLPDLLKRVRAGLESVDLVGAWDPFFAQLIRLHVGALHNEVPADDYHPAPPLAEDSSEIESSAECEPPAPPPGPAEAPSRIQLHVPEKKKAPPPPVAPAQAPERGDDRHTQRVQSLEVGAWVELQSFRGTRKTLRLSWISELRQVLLFTNRQGENALTIPASSLAQHLRKGTARILSPERLTDRAVAQLLSAVRPPDSGDGPSGS